MRKFTNSSGYDSQKSFKGYAGNLTEKKLFDIFHSANTEEIYEIKGDKYYISKDMGLDKIPENLKFGDAVLFERGGLWRIGAAAALKVPEGVIFGAYGEGEKPRLYGSSNNYADNSLWEKHSENIWKTKLLNGNVGIMVFDEVHSLGVKKWNFEDVMEDYDFYHNYEDDYLYFYYTGDIEADFESVEIGQRCDILEVHSNAVVDNLCIRYTGAHGIAIPSSRENVKVTNCEIGFIGGSCQFKDVRYGNGIEIQLGGKNHVIENNWVYQCYDAGITFQSWSSANRETYYENLKICGNLVEFCYYGLEFFTTTVERGGSYSEIRDVSVDGNIFRFSGYAWSYEQRPDHWMNAHIRSSQYGYMEPTFNLTFTNNVFDCSRANIVFWWWHDTERNYLHPNPHPGVSAYGNSFYQAPMPDKRCMTYFYVEPIYAEDIDGLTEAAKRFDSDPKDIVWVPEIG